MDLIRSRHRIDLLVDMDPETITWAYSQGIPSYLLLEPKFARPEFRPDSKSGVRTWGDLMSEIERQRELKLRYEEEQEKSGIREWE